MSAPETNALSPAPVTISTCALAARTSSSARCISATVAVSSALRFSGRFTVSVATRPELASSRFSKGMDATQSNIGRMRGFASVLIACAALARAQEAGKVPQPPPPFEQMLKMRAVLKLPGMDRVKVRRDVVYKKVGEAALLADVYAPPDAAASVRLPAVILIHGGPIPPGSGIKNAGVFQSLAELVAVSGMTAVTFNHRFHGAPMLVEASGDVRDLIRHVRENAAGYGIDAGRLALWAFSG